MRVFLICSIELGLSSGAGLLVEEYAKNLAAAGADVTLFAPRYRFKGSIPSVRVMTIPCGCTPYLSKILYQALLLPVLSWYILTSRPDCLLVKHSVVNLSFILPSWLFAVPFVLQVDADLTEELATDPRWVPRPYLWFLHHYENLIFGLAAAIVVVHPAMRRHLIASYSVDGDKITVIQNGVDTTMFRPLSQVQCQSELRLDPYLSYMVFVGHVQPWHGVDYIVNALPHLLRLRNDVRFLLVGDGPAMPEVRRQVDRLKVRHIIILAGQVPRSSVPVWLGATDVCLLPAKMTRSHPGNPIKLYEYLACGKPVIAAAVEGYGDVVEAQGLGVAVDYTDSSALARAIDSMLQRDLSSYSTHNRAVAVENHQWRKVGERLYTLLDRIVQGRFASVQCTE